jgi:DNA-binding transcriptional regulator YiaG
MMAGQMTKKRYRKLKTAMYGGALIKHKSGKDRPTSGRTVGYKHAAPRATTAGISVVEIRHGLGVSQEELGRVTGYSTRSIAGWEGGRQVLSDSARQKLVETDRLRAALAQIMPEEQLGDWLRAPNPAFEGQTPLQVIERGESDRLWRMIFQIDAGVAS